MKSSWVFVRKEIYKGNPMETIVFIRDLNIGRMSVTNDAESVFLECQKMYGRCRVVYQDSEGEWAEIVKQTTWLSDTVGFRPWHGMVWDRLTKV
jgi:hypothetical protein